MYVNVCGDASVRRVQSLAIQGASRECEQRGDRMKSEVINRIKGVDVHTGKTLSKQPMFSPRLFSGDNRQVTRWINWQANGVPSRICAMLTPLCNTPPPDRYIPI